MEWFLITSSEHLGPFEDDQILQMYSSERINDDSFLWKEGWDEPKKYSEIFLNIDEPPELPPDLNSISINDEIPPNNDSDDTLKSDKIDSSSNQELLVDNLETKELISEEESESESAVEFDNENLEQDVYDFTNDKPEIDIKSKFKSFLVIILIVLVTAPAYLYIKNSIDIFDRPQSMSLGDYKRLVNTAADQTGQLKFSFSLASDKRTLWISTNLNLEGEVFLKFKSKPGRTLGGDIELKAKGELNRHLIILSDFQFIQGTRFTDGIYDIEIFTVDDLEKPILKQFFGDWESQFRYLDQVIITSLHRKEFERQMNKIRSRKEENKNSFWSELEEKYRTILTMTNEIKNSIENIFIDNDKDWADKVSYFENSYKRKYGVFFTSFVSSNENSYENLIHKDFEDKFEIISSYSKLSKLAKEIGLESMVALQKLNSFDFKNKSQEDIDGFKNSLVMRLNQIIEESERKLNQIPTEL